MSLCNISCFSPKGTHSVQSVEAVHYLHHQLMTVQCSYLSGSTVRGVLTIAHSPTHTTYHTVYRNDTESVTQFSISGLSGEDYLIAVFDLDNAGLPETLPAVTLTPVTTDNINTPSHSEHTSLASEFTNCCHFHCSLCDGCTGNGILHPSSLSASAKVWGSSVGEICLSCTFSVELTGCVGVIQSAQLEDLTLTVLTVERSGGMNCTADGPMEGDYFVAGFGLTEGGLETNPALRDSNLNRVTTTQVIYATCSA